MLKININPIILYNTICPAVIFAYKRIINEKGLMIVPNSSIGANIIFIGTGTPGIQKICFQYSFFAVNVVIIYVNIAKAKVTAMLLFIFTPSGLNPNKFTIHIKKKIVKR